MTQPGRTVKFPETRAEVPSRHPRRGAAAHEVTGPGPAASNSQVFAARQPIVGRNQELVAYELLFRGAPNPESGCSSKLATATVLSEAVLTYGLLHMTDGYPAFINFTEELLLDGTAALLASTHCVIEILEHVPPSPTVLAVCRKLRGQGFRVALDDVVGCDRIAAFEGAFDIVKVDLRLAPADRWHALLRVTHGVGAMALAEKVEQPDEMAALRQMGFDYFQGYAVGRPLGVAQKPLTGLSAQHARLMEVVSQPEIDLLDLVDVVSADPTLAFRVLAYANSARAAQRGHVDSIRTAVMLFGQDEIRRAATLVVLSGLTEGLPGHAIIDSLVRARLCEDVATLMGQEALCPRYFLGGVSLNGVPVRALVAFLLSNLDLLLGRPMADIVRRLPITDDIATALVERSGSMGATLALAECYERADWDSVETHALEIGVPTAALPMLYARGIREANRLVAGAGLGKRSKAPSQRAWEAP